MKQSEENFQPDLNVEISKKAISELPQVNDRLTKIFELANSNRIINSGGLPFTEEDLDLENITVAIDNDANITNYTVTVNEIPSENVFYNIIVSEDELGNVGTPILYEYDMNPGFANQFRNGIKGLGDFRGTISRYNLLAFFDGNPLSGVVRNVIDPCEETDVDGGSSGGGSTGGTTGGDGGSTGGSGDTGEPCSYEIHETTCCECPEGCGTIIVIVCGETSAITPSPDDCPGQGGTAGVDYPEDSDPSAPYSNLDESMYNYLYNLGYRTQEEFQTFNDLYGRILQETSSGFPFPSTYEEWEEFGDILYEELFKISTLADILIPGYADFKSAIHQFKNGSYWGASFDLTLAVMDFFPLGKVADTSLDIAKKIRRSTKVLDVFNIVRRLGNTKVYNGFKSTIFKEYKNPHIFLEKAGHIGHPDFDFVLSRSGGQQEMIARVYERAFLDGKLANLTSDFSRQSIILDGRRLDFTAGKHPNGDIIISNFFGV